MDRDRVLFISLPKGRHPRIVRGVNERVTQAFLKKKKKTLRTSEISALPGSGSVGPGGKGDPRVCSRRKAR